MELNTSTIENIEENKLTQNDIVSPLEDVLNIGDKDVWQTKLDTSKSKDIDREKGSPYASYPDRNIDSVSWSSKYASYAHKHSRNLNVESKYAKYKSNIWINNDVIWQQTQEVFLWPEHTKEELGQIIDLLKTIEFAEQELPNIAKWADETWGKLADLAQTWASTAVRKNLEKRLADKRAENGGKLTMINQIAKFAINNLELLIEIYNSREMINKAKWLKLNTKNKAKIYALHGLDGVVSRLWAVWQAFDFFFNATRMSLWALESQVMENKEELNKLWVIHKYIDNPSTWIKHYMKLQEKYYGDGIEDDEPDMSHERRSKTDAPIIPVSTEWKILT